MRNKMKHKKIKEKGFTIVEILISSVLMILMINSIAIFYLHIEKRKMIDEMAYTTAQVMYNISIYANKYIDENIEGGVPDSFDIEHLYDNGYLEEASLLGSELPLGGDITFYANNENGFPLSVGMMITGDYDKSILSKYNLDNNLTLLSFNQKVVSYISELSEEDTYRAGVVNSDYRVHTLNNRETFDLNPFIDKDKTEIIEGKPSPAIFYNLQEYPGYWVINYSSVGYVEATVASFKKENNMYSLGYSDFCPSPNITLKENINSYIYDDEISARHHLVGNNYSNVFLCIPASKIESKADINEEITLSNQFFSNSSINGYCRMMNVIPNIVEFNLNGRYFTFKTASGRVRLHCYFANLPTFNGFSFQKGRLVGNNIDLNMIFRQSGSENTTINSGSYPATINNVGINRVNLN